MSSLGRRNLIILLSVLVSCLAQNPTPPPTRQLKFNTVTTPWNEPISLDYHEPSDTVISSAYFGVESTTNYNFGRIDSAGNWYPYSTVANIPGELNMATVPPRNIYPGPFVSGDIFGGNNNYYGTILRVTTGGQANLNWCSLPGSRETFAFGGFYVDRTGVWDYHLIGITGNSAGNTIGEVWKIDPNCANPVKLTEVHDWCEGIIVVPNNATRWGPLAGAILLGCEVSTKLIAIKPNNGGVVSWVTGSDQVSTDDLDLIQPGQNWFGMSWTSGKYIGVSWDQWVGYEGYILASTHGTGLNIIWWNFQTGAPGWTRLTSETGSPYQPGTLWEQSSFTPSGISEILPFSYSLCILPQINGVNQTWGPSGPLPVKLTTASAIGNYQYSISTPYSSAATLIPPQQGALIMYFTQDAQNVFSLTATVASSDAGSLTLTVTSTGLGSPSVVVQDDPATAQSGSGDFPDTTFWQNGQGSFTWSWGAGRTDGFVLSPLSFISPPNNQAFQINIKVTSHSSNIQNWYFYSANSSLYYSVGIDNSLSLIRVSCTCGNGKTDAYEECDAGPSGDSCCTSDCKFRSLNQLCPQNLVGNCDAEDTPAANDRCQGYSVDCAALTTCNDCALASQCGWCCTTQSCVAGNSTNPPSSSTCPVFQGHTCGCANTCVHGTCQCTNCTCEPSWGGATCNMVVGCDGNLYAPNDPAIPVVDVCNVCNGNGTTCLGCDGQPYGAKNDSCGVCGGDGSSCYSWCTDHNSCDSCLGTEGCIWCASAKVCQQSGYRYLTDCEKWIDDCSDNFWDNLSPTVKGVSAGVLAAIIIAGAVAVAVLAFGGKKGYDLLVNTKMPTEGVMVSPLYEDSNMRGMNPMYKEPDNNESL